MPSQRIFRDVPADAIQVACIADDVFPVIALPERCARCLLYTIDTARDDGFEILHDGTQRPRFGAGRMWLR